MQRKKVKYYKKSKYVKIRKSLMGSALILPIIVFKHILRIDWKTQCSICTMQSGLEAWSPSSLPEPACNHFVAKPDVTVQFWFLLKSHNKAKKRAIFVSVYEHQVWLLAESLPKSKVNASEALVSGTALGLISHTAHTQME